MTPKFLGACMIISACGAMGMSLAATHRQKERLLQSILSAVHYMRCELEYRMTPLPQLMHLCAEETDGMIRKVFHVMAEELARRDVSQPSECMQIAVDRCPKLPPMVKEKLLLLGNSLGRFDLSGQLAGIEMVSAICKRDLDGLLHNREGRLRSYITLGICAGVALVIVYL